MANFLCNPSQQNYYLKKNLAYTEDHIVVKKLYLQNIANKVSLGKGRKISFRISSIILSTMPCNILLSCHLLQVKAPELQRYFEGFGQVDQLQLFGCKVTARHCRKKSHRLGQAKTGFVCFANALDAAKALRLSNHTINGRRMYVQANDSWHQPDAYGTEPQGAEQDEQPALILTLDDHCLEYIMRELVLSDRIHFARTCTRFRSVYEQVSPALHKSLQFDELDALTLWDIRDFFQLSGSHLQQIEGIVPRARCQRLCEYFGTHCVNLRSMNVTGSKFSVRNMRKIFANLELLQVLKIRACALSNDSLQALRHLTQLMYLDLSENYKLTGVNMHQLPKSLETLILSNCNGLLSNFLAKFCKALPRLKRLDLKSVYSATAGLQQMVTGKCGNALEELTFSSLPNKRYEHIAKLPCLTKLVVYNYEEGSLLRPELLTWLVQHKAQQLLHFEVRGQNCLNDSMIDKIGQLTALQTLVLPHNHVLGDRELGQLMLPQLKEINLKYWFNLSDTTVLRLLVACPKLQVLHLEECHPLTERLLHDILIKLRDKEKKRSLPIKLFVYGSQITSLGLQIPEVAAKDIIDVSLAPPATSDLSQVRMPNLLEFDFYADDYDSFGSDDELDPNFDRYMFDMGLLSEDDYDYDDMLFNMC